MPRNRLHYEYQCRTQRIKSLFRRILNTVLFRQPKPYVLPDPPDDWTYMIWFKTEAWHQLIMTFCEETQEAGAYLDGEEACCNDVPKIHHTDPDARFWSATTWDTVLDSDNVTAIYNEGQTLELRWDNRRKGYNHSDDLLHWWSFSGLMPEPEDD